MPSSIPRAVKQESVILGTQGIKPQDIAITLNISVDTVRRVATRVRKYGDVEGGYQKSGPKGKIDHFMEEVNACFYLF
jgi:transposase